MNLPTNYRSAIHVNNHIQKKKFPTYATGQIGDIPAPNLIWRIGQPSRGRWNFARRFCPATALVLMVLL
jgi:hypothetical protein